MKKIAPLLVVLAGLLWGTMGLFVHGLADFGLSAIQMVEVRAVITSVILIPTLAVIRPSLLRVRLRHLWCFVGTGFFSVIFFNFCYMSTITRTSMSVAAVLLYTSPIFVMLLSRLLFGEPMTGRKWIALGLAFGGCLLVSGVLLGGAPLTPLSFLTGVGAGFGYALYSIFSRYALQYGYSGWTITAYTFTVVSIGGILFTDFQQVAGAFASGGWRFAGFSLLFALVTTLLPYICYTAGLCGMDNSRAAVLASVEPVVATLLGLIFLHQVPSVGAVIGMLLVLSAVLLLSLAPPDKPRHS